MARELERGTRRQELVDEGVLHSDALLADWPFGGERLYQQQERAARASVAGRPFLVTTGIGSGKTEALLRTVLDGIPAAQARGRDRASVGPTFRAAMAEKGFWPLYEGKHIHSRFLRGQPITRWVNIAAAERRTAIKGRRERTVVRRIAAPTDERTLIAAVLEPEAFSNDQLVVVESPLVQAAALATHLGSLPVDFAIRPRVMRHLDQHILRMLPLPVTPPTSTVMTREWAPRQQHPFDDDVCWEPIWLSNRVVAEAYGLGPDHFEHILSTFPVFARKRPAFYAYLRERLAEWKEEVGLAGRRVVPPRQAPPLSRVAEPRATYGGDRKSEA